MHFRLFGKVSRILGCAAALSVLTAPLAGASFVEVVRLDGEGGVVMVPGDLVTPSLLSTTGSAAVPAPGGSASLDLGPIFAEVVFSHNPTGSLSSVADTPGMLPPMTSGSITGSERSVSAGGSHALGGGSFLSGTVVGTAGVDSDLSGTLDGTIGSPSTFTIEGTLTPAPSVPLPGAAWLFGTGLAGLVGLLSARNSLRPRSRRGLENEDNHEL